MKFIVSCLFFLVAAILAYNGFPQHGAPQWGYYPQPNYPSYSFPTMPSSLSTLWNPDSSLVSMGHGMYNPWGNFYRHHHHHHQFYPNHHFGIGYNFADRFAYQFFMRHGFNVKTALYFCNSLFTRTIVWQSPYLINYCNYINRNYGRGNDYVPTYPNVPDNAPVPNPETDTGYPGSIGYGSNEPEQQY